jgi:hypothetical protein
VVITLAHLIETPYGASRDKGRVIVVCRDELAER